MSHDNGCYLTGNRMRVINRYKNRSGQIFMQIAAADSAPFHSNFYSVIFYLRLFNVLNSYISLFIPQCSFHTKYLIFPNLLCLPINLIIISGQSKQTIIRKESAQNKVFIIDMVKLFMGGHIRVQSHRA